MSSPETPNRLRDQRRLFWVCWSLSALYNVSWGVVFPLVRIYFRRPEIGLSFQQIGWLGAIRAAVGLVAPLVVGAVADRTGRQKPLMLLGFLLAALSTAAYLPAQRFLAFAAITVAATFALSAYNVPVNTLVTRTLSEKSRGRQFGQFRISGSIGFATASLLLLPIVSRDPSYRAVFLTGAAAYLLCFLVAAVGIRESNAWNSDRTNWGAWREVLRQRNLRVLYTALAIGSIGSSMCWSFFSNHLDETLHLSKSTVGLMFGIQTLTEIPALILLGWVSDRWGRKPILVLASAVNGIRWLLIGWVPSVEWLVPVQLLWGIAFANVTVSVALITDLARDSIRTSAIGLMSFAWGVGNTIGPTLGGYLADHWGLPLVFRVGGVFGLAAALLLGRLLSPAPRPGAPPPLIPPQTDSVGAPPVLRIPERLDRRRPESAGSASTR